MTTITYSLDEFIHDMNMLVDTKANQEKIFDVGSTLLERLINNPSAIPNEFRFPPGASNHGSYLLHHGDNGLLITTVVWGPGDHLGPHDHRTWGMIGVIDNSIHETRYRRHDDRSRRGYAEIEKDRLTIVTTGDVSLLIPEVDEIHEMDNPSDRPTVELHVYGTDLRGLERSKFDVDSGRVTHFSTKKFSNC